MRSLLALLLSISGCATVEPCSDVDVRTRITTFEWMRPVSGLTVLLHNPRDRALSATLDCTTCDGAFRQRVNLGPHEHMPVLLAKASDGCECNLEHDEVMP